MFMKIQNSISHITESDNQIWISLNIYPAFDLSGGGELGGLTPHWLKMTPTLVTENFCLWGRLRPPPLSPDPARPTQRADDITVLFIPILKTEKPIAFGCMK